MMAIQDKVQAGLRLRAKAQQYLASARGAFAEHRWEAGKKAITSACRLAKDDPVVWGPALNEVVEACRASSQEEPGLAEQIFRELSSIGSVFPLPSLVQQGARNITTDEPRAEFAQPAPPPQPDQISNDLPPAEAPRAKPNEADPATPRWIDKVRRAVQSLSGPEHDRPQAAECAPKAAPPPALDASQDQKTSTREPDRNTDAGPEPKISPTPEKGNDREQGARVIEFPAVAEAPRRSHQASATDLFMAGSAAPARPSALPTERSLEPRISATPLQNPPTAPLDAPPSHAPEGEIQSKSTSSPWASNLPENSIRRIEKELATHIGPLAKVLVKRALASATTLDELYSALATNLSNPADRKAFLAARLDSGGQPTGQGAVHAERLDPVRTGMEGRNPALDREIDRESLDRAIRILARYVGPISTVLVKRAAQNTRSVRGLYLLLAERVTAAERERFLQDSGLSG